MGCTIEQWTAKSTGSDSDWAAVRLVVEEPEVGPEVMTPVQVEIQIEGDPATKVRIDTPDGSESIEVEEA